MRVILLITTVFLGHSLMAQKNIDERFNLNGQKKVELSFKWPNTISVHNWDGDEVKITGSVLINNGENNDAFRFRAKTFQGLFSIETDIANIDDLPRKIMIKRDGMSYYFNTQNWDDPEVQKFMNQEGGRSHEYASMGVIKEIELEVYVPKNVEVVINSKYGMVEINNLVNPISVNAKYGGIDMAFGANKNSLEARTRYGEIYSNLPFDLETNRSGFNSSDKWTIVTYKGNSGHIVLESKYGDVFLRQKRGG